MAATIPTLRSFIRGYEKAMGWESSYYIRNTASRTTGTYAMSTMNKSRHEEEGGTGMGLHRLETNDTQPLRPDRQGYKASIYGGGQGGLNDVSSEGNVPRRTKSSGSNDSQEPIIRKDVEIQVSSEAAI
jgi:hypothetical protein